MRYKIYICERSNWNNMVLPWVCKCMADGWWASSAISHTLADPGTDLSNPNCSSTLVTAYYKIPSKHSHTMYTTWMTNFLSLPDCLVVFVEPGLEGLVRTLRPDSLHPYTLIISRLSDIYLRKTMSADILPQPLLQIVLLHVWFLLKPAELIYHIYYIN